MKGVILSVLFCVLFLSARAKVKTSTEVDSLPHAKTKERNQTVKELFKASDDIELVAYPLRPNLGKSINVAMIDNGKFMAVDIKKRTKLVQAQIEKLLSILSPPKMPADSASSADCYNPQHAIVFYKNKIATAYLEVCFSCGGERHTAGIDFGIISKKKLCLLEQFFISNKIDFGIEMDEYKSECGDSLGLH